MHILTYLICVVLYWFYAQFSLRIYVQFNTVDKRLKMLKMHIGRH